MKQRVIIVTDLDGSLLNHDDYSFNDANTALQLIKNLEIPLIFNTSKTFAEVLRIRKQLKNLHPFILENGSSAAVPNSYFPDQLKDLPALDGYLQKSFGEQLTEFLPLLHQLRDQHNVNFRGFSEMSAQEIIDLTGLSEIDANNARQRQYSEPVVWLDSDQAWQRFAKILKNQHLYCLRGGRFISISTGGNKGTAVSWLKSIYADMYGVTPIIIALGDSNNDIDMLKTADFPVLIQSPVNQPPATSELPNIIRPRETGAAGWNSAVVSILDMLDKGATTHG